MAGWLYALSVLLAGLAGFALAPRAQGGWATGSAFVLLALCWLGSTAIGVRHALLGDIDRHRRWMLRSVALTFAAVTLRLYLVAGLALLHLDFATVYLASAWLCWTLNLLAIEVYLSRSGGAPARARQALGVSPVRRLKAALKVDFEVKPQA